MLLLAACLPMAAAQRAPSFRYFWTVHGVDCFPDIELGNCSSTHPPPYTAAECKRACLDEPNCGGFNLPKCDAP
eukprot:SAG25_NODE_4490_length_803_cov_2.166193_2_plen_73_part_01